MSEKAPSINPAAEQAVTFKDKEYFKKGTDEVVAHHVNAVDADGNETHVSIDDMLLARGYETKQPGKPAKNPAETPVIPDTEMNPYEIWAQGVQTARDKVSRKRMIHAHMAADDYAEGHDRLSDNPHIADLTGEEKKAFALAQADKQTHADRIAGDGAYDEELERIKEGVKGKVDKEIKDRLENDGSTWEYWTGENDGEGDDDDKEEEPKPLTLVEQLSADTEYQKHEKILKAARDRYAELTAKRRKISTLGIRGRGTSVKELDEAREAYEKARNDTGAYVADKILERGADADEVAAYSLMGAVMELHTLEHKIVDKRLEEADGKKLKYFYNKWASWGGGAKFFSKERMKGNWKKGLAVGVLMAPGVALASPFLGAGVVAAGMLGMARGLARGHIDKNAKASELARVQSAEHIRQGEAQIEEDWADGARNFQAGDITLDVEGHTKKEVRRNRTRLGVGVAAGFLAPLAIDKALNLMGGINVPNPTDKVGHRIPKPPQEPGSPFEGMSFNELEDFRNMVAHPERFGNLQARASELQSMHPGWSPAQIREHLVGELRASNPRY